VRHTVIVVTVIVVVVVVVVMIKCGCCVFLKPRRYDYLEFTDARGGKVRYDTKIGTEKWPKVG